MSRVEYNSNENLFTITKREEIIDFKRIENPSGFLYTFNNGQTWEGKDLELVYRDEEKTPAPKDFIESFEIGDKVKLPLTKKGLKLKQYMSVVWDNAIKNGEDFLVVNAVDGVKIILNNYLAAYEDNDGDYFNIKLDNIELYETSEKPLLPDKSKNITSKTTKAFYENNKYKLDKIDSNISIKFIQALEFLSQYEESGQDIYTQKNKTIADDLISRIKNLKKQ